MALRVAVRYSVVLGHLNKSLGCRWASHAVSYRNALDASETNVSTLKNKLRVATDSTLGATATVGVWIEAGSRHETAKNNGVSHLFEHLAFKGNAKKSANDIELEAESNGMQLVARSSREVTAVCAKCLAGDVPKAVELLSDVVLRGSLAESDVDAQRTAVLKELEEAENNSTTVVMDYMYASGFQATPLAQSVLGTTKSVESLRRKDLTDFIGARFKAPRMVLAATGGVEHRELVGLAEKYFADASLNGEVAAPQRCRFTGSEIRARYDDLPLAHITIAVEGAGLNNPQDALALSVAQTVIGSWDRTYGAGANLSSKLASACAQEEMCHSFQSFYDQLSDTGLWGTYFVSDRLTIEDMMFNVQGEWMRLCSSVTEFEIERAKNQLKMALFQQYGSTCSAADNVARQVLFGNNNQVTTLAQLDANIDAVTAKTVRDVCMKYLYDKCPVVAGVGPVEGLPDYNRVRGGMYWLRL